MFYAGVGRNVKWHLDEAMLPFSVAQQFKYSHTYISRKPIICLWSFALLILSSVVSFYVKRFALRPSPPPSAPGSVSSPFEQRYSVLVTGIITTIGSDQAKNVETMNEKQVNLMFVFC